MTDSNEIYDILIIGAGCAGLSSAMYAGRFGLKTIVLGELPGGTITQTHLVENFPSYKSLTGMELGTKLLDHAKAYDVPIKMEIVSSVKKLEDGNFQVISDSQTYISKTVIIATGTEHRKLNVPGEKEFTNKGVHYCALCDGAFYKDKIITVVGSGDSAVKESLLLADFGSKINLLVRKDHIKGEPINNKRLMENEKIEVFYNVEVKEILGDKNLEKLKLTRAIAPKGQGTESDELKTDAIFVLVGHIANTQLAKDLGVELDKKGEIIIDKMSRTNTDGIFGAGDCCNTEFKQAIISSAEGVAAAYSANQYLKKKG